MQNLFGIFFCMPDFTLPPIFYLLYSIKPLLVAFFEKNFQADFFKRQILIGDQGHLFFDKKSGYSGWGKSGNRDSKSLLIMLT